jgi:putrescine transport system substrate-binding protein
VRRGDPDNGPELLPIALNYLGLPPHSKKPEDYKKPKRC